MVYKVYKSGKKTLRTFGIDKFKIYIASKNNAHKYMNSLFNLAMTIEKYKKVCGVKRPFINIKCLESVEINPKSPSQFILTIREENNKTKKIAWEAENNALAIKIKSKLNFLIVISLSTKKQVQELNLLYLLNKKYFNLTTLQL